MKLNNKRLYRLYQGFSTINRIAYKNIYLLSNPVLSKSPFYSDIINIYLSKKTIKKVSHSTIFIKVCIYYGLNFIYFSIYLLKLILFKYSRINFKLSNSEEEIVIIDNYFYLRRIYSEKTFKDICFPGLGNILNEKAIYFAYVPLLSGSRNPLLMFDVFKILKKEKIPILTEFQLFRIYDYLYILLFIAKYPFHVLNFAKTIRRDSFENEIIKFALIDNLDKISVDGYIRYLFGKKLVNLDFLKIKCISWYENQIIDINLYKGLRSIPEKVKIYGSQLFLYPFTILNINPDESLTDFGIVPDKIIVNGTYYLPKNGNITKYQTGPSLRYKKIFQSTLRTENCDTHLVLLSYIKYEIVNVLKLIQNKCLSDYLFLVKFHPSTNIKKYKRYIQDNMNITYNDLYDLFKKAKIAIGAETGALIEAASLGIPVIFIENKNRFSHNPLPEYGKGLIWDKAENCDDLIRLINKHDNNSEQVKESIRNIASNYKDMFFCETNENNISEVFDL